MKISPLTIRCLFAFILLNSTLVQAQNAWVNEFHYDNLSTDEEEFIEIVIQNKGNYDLSLFTLWLYNGSDGETYGSSYLLDSFTESYSKNGFTFFYKDISGIQNGADAFALSYDDVLIQFISYEGGFLGVGGVADGVFSQDIGVTETTSTPVGQSLQLAGSGLSYSDFNWQGPEINTKGQPNSSQSFISNCLFPSIQAQFNLPLQSDLQNTSVTLNWTRGDGDSVLVLVRENALIDVVPENGTVYSAEPSFGGSNAEELGVGNFVMYNAKGNSVTISDLTAGYKYHFAIFEYDLDGVCYLLPGDTISVITELILDQDSEILAPSNQISSMEISSLSNTQNDAVEVFKFKITDQGTTDNAPTILKKLVINKSDIDDTKNWSEIIAGAMLKNQNKIVEVESVTINPDNIEIDLIQNGFVINDGSSETFNLLIWLKPEQIDQKVLGFQISKAHGFETDSSGSSFISDLTNVIPSEEVDISVEATSLSISEYLSQYFVKDEMSFKLQALDSHGNIDRSKRQLSLLVYRDEEFLRESEIHLNEGTGFFSDLLISIPGSYSLDFSDGNISEEIQLLIVKPEITLDTTGFENDFGRVYFPNSSEIGSYSIYARNLKDSLFISVPEGFEVSEDSTFSDATTDIVFSPDSLITAELFVRFTPLSAGGQICEGTIKHFSAEADTVELNITAEEATLELSSISTAKAKALGSRANVQGFVVGGNMQFEERRVIQDSTAGIAIEGFNTSQFKFGDRVEVSGELKVIDNWVTLVAEKYIEQLDGDSMLIIPAILSINEVDSTHFGQRIEFKSLEVLGEGVFEKNEYILISKEFDTVNMVLNRIEHPLIGEKIPKTKININGVIHSSHDGMYIYPEFLQDIELAPRDTILSIQIPSDSLIFESVMLDAYSDPKNYILSCESLSEDVSISVDDNFEISLIEDRNYTQNLKLPIDDIGNIPPIKIYVRFAPHTAKQGELEGIISHQSGTHIQEVKVKGYSRKVLSVNKEWLNRIKLYPNPFDERITILNTSQNSYYYQLINSTGVIIMTGELQNELSLELRNLSTGIYLFKIQDISQKQAFRIVKK